jgi:hypothetical protein
MSFVRITIPSSALALARRRAPDTRVLVISPEFIAFRERVTAHIGTYEGVLT